MNRIDIKDFIAARAAKELNNGDVVNLGIGLPTLVTNHLPDNIKVVFHSENGIIGTGPVPGSGEAEPLYIVDAGGSPAMAAPGGCYIDSCVSFSLIRGGHVDCTILGALEVDEHGSLSSWIIPGQKVAGMGGAMDLAAGAKNIIVAMEHTARGRQKILKKCRLPLTAVGVVKKIITEMGVMSIRNSRLILEEYNPEYSIEDIQAATEAELIISETLAPMR
jgi:acetate CoA/acetoacetate CoA-transferase beta subunit